jgi:hypothetical protein
VPTPTLGIFRARHLSKRIAGHRILRCTGAAVMLALAECDDSVGPQMTIVLDVRGDAPGAGQVTSLDQRIRLECPLSPGSAVCPPVSFTDGGAGGSIALQAIPAEGSTFSEWIGCTSATENTCTLTFSPSAGDTTFHVVVSFAVAGTAPVLLRNRASAVTNEVANLLAPNEDTLASNRLQVGESRTAYIDSTLASTPTFTAFVHGSFAVSATCMVTTDAWQGGTRPVVTFGGDFVDGYFLHCDGF